MKGINIDTWNRKEHFNFFRNIPYPLYNICFDISVTRLREYAKDKKLSFNLSMIHVTTEALNEIENFKYRLRGDAIILHDSLAPSYTDLEKGSELFKMVTVDMEKDREAFVRNAEEKAKSQTCYFNISDFINRDDLVFYSIIPWISFTGIDHTINMKQGDAIPRVSFGKYYSKEKELCLPFNIQVNHLFVDGIHLGMLKDKMDEKIMKLS